MGTAPTSPNVQRSSTHTSESAALMERKRTKPEQAAGNGRRSSLCLRTETTSSLLTTLLPQTVLAEAAAPGFPANAASFFPSADSDQRCGDQVCRCLPGAAGTEPRFSQDSGSRRKHSHRHSSWAHPLPSEARGARPGPAGGRWQVPRGRKQPLTFSAPVNLT